jgi:steroid delta-isomerase-like uncharacterized protein
MSTEQNKALARRFIEEIWNQKNLALARELIAATYVFHTPGSPPGLPPGPEGFHQFASAFLTAFPDVHTSIEDQLAEGDKVVTRWTSRGTNTGSLFGMPTTGKSATITGITIDRFAEGKIVESWDELDQLGMLQQLGVIPVPQQEHL